MVRQAAIRHAASSHNEWRKTVTRDELNNDYAEAVGRARGLAIATELGMALQRLVPHLREGRRSTDGVAVRKRCWEFPSLADCRKHFDELLHRAHDWPEEDPQ